MNRFGLALVLVGASLGYGPWCLADTGAGGASAASVARLGIERVLPPALPGAKVRTPARIEGMFAYPEPAATPGPATASPYGLGADATTGKAATGRAGLQAMSLEEGIRALQQGRLDAWMGVIPADQAVPDGLRAEPLAWSAAAMAIMRTDTDIHAWRDLAGRSVCVSGDGRHVDEVAARYGAIEQIYPAAADALLALRTGGCDAAVMDEALLQHLLAFPEWQKFSTRLRPTTDERLWWISRRRQAGNPAAVSFGAPEPADLQALGRSQARDIAFEVYLDQTVPDCH